MRYITGIHALNMMCELNTPGDWHQSALDWSKPEYGETTQSIYGMYGISFGYRTPNGGTFPVANHIRACLDLIMAERYAIAGGMREDFICNESYTPEIFNKVLEARGKVSNRKWKRISGFMQREYKLDWVNFIEAVH